MERAARTARVRSLRRGDHMAWVYADRTDRRTGVLEHLRGGLGRRERLFYTALGDRTELLADLRGLVEEPQRLIDTGQLIVCSLDDCFRRLDAMEHVEVCASITTAALADGWAGLRMVADVTPLCADTDDHAPFLDAELRLGAWLATSALTRLCLFDEAVLGPAAPELTCTHSHGSHHDSCFGVRLVDGLVRVEGELDASVADAFGRVLRAALRARDGMAIVDTSGVTFADLSACRALHETVGAVRSSGHDVEVRDISSPLARACELAGLPLLSSTER